MGIYRQSSTQVLFLPECFSSFEYVKNWTVRFIFFIGSNNITRGKNTVFNNVNEITFTPSVLSSIKIHSQSAPQVDQ